MQTLETLLRRWGKRGVWWLGKRPDVRQGQLAKAIAAQVGYPTSATDPFSDGGLIRLDKAQAAHVLAVAATTSLAYGNPLPRRGAVKDARLGLDDLADDAVFLSNGLWGMNSRGWNPLTSATFDCGVIGYDTENAFIFWVEEED